MTMLGELLRRELRRSAEAQDLTSPQQLLTAAQQTAARRRRGVQAAGALVAAAVTVTAVTAVTGLGDPDDDSPAVTATPSSPATDGPAVLAQITQRFYPASVVHGRLTRRGDCLVLRNRYGASVPLWPRGSTWDAAASSVVLPDGVTRWRIGDHGEQGGAALTLGPWMSEPYGDAALAALEVCAESVGTDQVALVAPPDSSD